MIVQNMANSCFVNNGILWRRFKPPNKPSRVLLMLPASMRPAAIQAAHGDTMLRHDGVYKTKERLLQCYWWSTMVKDIDEHIKTCHRCQIRKKNQALPSLLQPLRQTTELYQRIHSDLFPFRTNSHLHRNKKCVLTITDAFIKCVELVAITDKEAGTVAEALFERWFCQYGTPWRLSPTRARSSATASTTN